MVIGMSSLARPLRKVSSMMQAAARTSPPHLRNSWAAEGLQPMESLAAWDDLCVVNAKLWQVEDDLRAHEAGQDFGSRFVELARSVYHLNDQRADLKRAINDALGSELVEEKSYQDYRLA